MSTSPSHKHNPNVRIGQDPLFGTPALHLLMSSVGTIAIVVELIDSDLIRRLEGRRSSADGGRMKLKGFAVLGINSQSRAESNIYEGLYFVLLTSSNLEFLISHQKKTGDCEILFYLLKLLRRKLLCCL